MSQDRSLARRIVSKGWRLMISPLSVIQNWYHDVLSAVFELLLDGKWLIDYLPSSGSGLNTVVLVRLDLMGDFVLWLDSAKAYRDLLRPGLHKIIGFATRTQGLLVALGNPLQLQSLADVAQKKAERQWERPALSRAEPCWTRSWEGPERYCCF